MEPSLLRSIVRAALDPGSFLYRGVRHEEGRERLGDARAPPVARNRGGGSGRGSPHVVAPAAQHARVDARDATLPAGEFRVGAGGRRARGVVRVCTRAVFWPYSALR